MKYIIDYRLHGHYQVEIETDKTDMEEIKNLAEEKFFEADFGDAKNIEGRLYHIESEDNKTNKYFE